MTYKYIATVHTSSEGGAGTNENVYLRLIGSQGNDGDFFLDSEDNDFETSDIGHYQMTCEKFLGNIKELYLYVESNDDDSPAWKLDYIEIKAFIAGENKIWKFPVYSWVGIPGKDAAKPDVINHLWIDNNGVYNTKESNENFSKKSIG